ERRCDTAGGADRGARGCRGCAGIGPAVPLPLGRRPDRRRDPGAERPAFRPAGGRGVHAGERAQERRASESRGGPPLTRARPGAPARRRPGSTRQGGPPLSPWLVARGWAWPAERVPPPAAAQRPASSSTAARILLAKESVSRQMEP